MKNITTHTPDTGTASAKFFAGEQKRGTLAGAAACNPTAAVRELGPLAVILAGCGGPAPAQSVATSQGAPELLAALERLANAVDAHCRSISTAALIELDDATINARAAIAKATGGAK